MLAPRAGRGGKRESSSNTCGCIYSAHNHTQAGMLVRMPPSPQSTEGAAPVPPCAHRPDVLLHRPSALCIAALLPFFVRWPRASRFLHYAPSPLCPGETQRGERGGGRVGMNNCCSSRGGTRIHNVRCLPTTGVRCRVGIDAIHDYWWMSNGESHRPARKHVLRAYFFYRR